jgi:hypothetical protein
MSLPTQSHEVLEHLIDQALAQKAVQDAIEAYIA